MIKIKFLARKFLPPLFLSAQHFYEKSEGAGSVLLTNGSGRPKNTRTWIRMRFRNNATNHREDPKLETVPLKTSLSILSRDAIKYFSTYFSYFEMN
jgi:hypothetical protein